ncbi:DNA helicase [Nitzschia inconspicua]|uniref:DNA helicase n=1 Tax=Nitzschia inconspicua TaxID=303405 RepID=A0A9K3KPM3_9STRA|nr:DNA helicase [Nitzschia inconspicua]
MEDEVPPADVLLEGLSQDIIEWDESNNVDLRTLYPSPNHDERRTPTTNSASTPNSSLFLGKGQYQYQQYNDNNNNDNNNNASKDSTKINLDRTFRDASLPKQREQQRMERMEGAERQIDSILGILRMNDNQHTSVSALENGVSDERDDTRTLKRRNSSPSEMATQQQGNKRRTLGELQRRRSHPSHKAKDRASQLRERLRRRMEQRRRHRPNRRSKRPQHIHPNNTTTDNTSLERTTTSDVSIDDDLSSQASNAETPVSDVFSELLDALKTPKVSDKASTSRVPLTAIDDNALDAKLSVEENVTKNIAFSKTNPDDGNFNTQSSRVSISPQAPGDTYTAPTSETTTTTTLLSNDSSIPRHPQHKTPFHRTYPRQVQETAPLELTPHTGRDAKPSADKKVHSARLSDAVTKPEHGRVKHKDNDGDDDDDDEFGDLSFSLDDLAMIDSLAGASISNSTAPRVLPKKSDSSAEQSTSSKTCNVPTVYPKHAVFQDDDELLDRIDFYKIDALIADRKSKQVTKETVGFDLKVTGDNVVNSRDSIEVPSSKAESGPIQQQSASDEDEEYGNLPEDLDFGRIDALIAHQCKKTILNSQQDRIATKQTESTETKHENDHDADDFDDFPCDIDFNNIDALIRKKQEQEKALTGHGSLHLNESFDGTRSISNERAEPVSEGSLSYTRYTRYRVVRVVNDDTKNNIKTISVASWDHTMTTALNDTKRIHRPSNATPLETLPHHDSELNGNRQVSEDGFLTLAGEWYYTPVKVGDILHLCSLFGRYRTDKAALPIALHTSPPSCSDDLVLVLHPDMMMTPSTISEASTCIRRAVLKSKLGSTGITSKAALVGTMVHAVFEECLSGGRFDLTFARQVVKRQLKEKVEMVIGCNSSEAEIEQEVLNAVPTIRKFAVQYTTLLNETDGHFIGGVACHPDIHYLGRGVHSVEESIVSTELGLKGDIDAVLEVETRVAGHRKTVHDESSETNSGTMRNLMCLELKTGHNQVAQLPHLAQLSLYTFMLQTRYGTMPHKDDIRITRKANFRDNGSASSGILLYLNEKAKEIYHVAPEMNEVKTLISQRNVVATELYKASQPRGISLSYEDGTRANDGMRLKVDLRPAPPAILPDLTNNAHSCKRCFSKRECMLYAAAGSKSVYHNHHELLAQFTSHLSPEDFDYFRKWDRLIDIESDATSAGATTAWLTDSRIREDTGDAICGLLLDQMASTVEKNQMTATICLYRRESSQHNPLNSLGFSSGSNVIVSTDATLENSLTENSQVIPLRHYMHLVKGFVDRIDGERVFISCKSTELRRIVELVRRQQQAAECDVFFRIDKSTNSIGTGTLRWNLINFLSEDADITTAGKVSPANMIKKNRLLWLRDVVIRLKEPEFDGDKARQLFDRINSHIPGCHVSQLRQDFESLNEAQQKAICKAMSAGDYTLIQGLPGTGKSSTISFLARLLVAKGKRVLVTAYTHSAVDNVMLKLIESGVGGSFSGEEKPTLVRVGQEKSCHKDVKKILYTELAVNFEDGRELSSNSLRVVVAGAGIVGVSVLSLPRSPVLLNEHFHVVIVDEAGQMNQPAALGALMAADSFILVGDHKQLPPLVNSEIAEEGGFGVSIMTHLAEKHPSAISPLNLQYRMNEEICRVSSEAFYGGMMKCGNDMVKYQRLQLPGFPGNLRTSSPTKNCAWIEKTVDPKYPVLFLNTDTVIVSNKRSLSTTAASPVQADGFVELEGRLGGRPGGSTINETEANVVEALVETFMNCGLDGGSVGIISPFRAQIRIMEESERMASFKLSGLELSTIDKYQGRDKEVIILSMVRSNHKGSTGRLLQDGRRLNVAFTRAKCKMIIVGSFSTLCRGSSHLKPILTRMKQRQEILNLPAEL